MMGQSRTAKKPWEDFVMNGKFRLNSASLTRRTFAAGVGAAGLAGVAPFNVVRAEGGPLKVGVLLPRSGLQAGIGQDCQRGVDIAPGILKSLGLPELAITNGDTESNVDTARARAEQLIGDGAQLLVGAFDSGQTTAIAQVAEQKGIPLVINIAGSPAITEQGYKFVFRNFPTGPMIVGDAFANQKEVFAAAGVTPKTVVFMHINDTYGMSIVAGVEKAMPHFDMPYSIVEKISYDPAARDLSVEVAKAKATNADALLVVSRLNDAMLMTRELVKQRWTPQAILSMGPGWYEDQYFRTLGKLADGPISFVPWYDPHKKLTGVLEAALAKADPGVLLNTNHIFTFEALLVAADAYKRAASTNPTALADAIRATNIADNVTIGPGISFNAKGQNDKVKNGAIQNRGNKIAILAPKDAADAKPEWPMASYQGRG
jgi:branched-chain amino acid transport system substrate-binding protein